MVDTAALQRTFGLVAQHGDEVPLYFYSHLFLRYPQTRTMFPASMSGQRDRLVGALVRVVGNVHQVQTVVPYLQQLARDHRKYGVLDEHYPLVGAALLATLEHFLGDEWTAELAADWAAAYGVIAGVMTEAATEAAVSAPPWYDAEVVDHEIRAPGIAVITVRPDKPVEFVPGQSLSVQAPASPRVWRYLSPANAPRSDDTLEFHVRAVDGGWVSPALVHSTGKGDVLRMGAPVGDGLALVDSGAPIVMLAGGTGLAPLRSIVEQIAQLADQGAEPPAVHLFPGARSEAELYDLAHLRRLELERGWLTVIPVVMPRLGDDPRLGLLAEVAIRAARSLSTPEVYVCGSAPLVAATLEKLAAAGLDPNAVHRETYSYSRHEISAQKSEVEA